ncbi:MAG: hypothetical protein WCS65_06670 [Verrucomicrobiae bacterium]
MNRVRSLKIVASLLSLAIFTSACENMTPGENAALFGGLTAVAVGVPLALAGVDPSIVIPVTAGAAVLVAGASYVIAKHQATERQRQVAEQRARLYMAKRAEATRLASSSSRSSSGSTAKKSAKPAPEPRYIAINTEKSGAAAATSGPSVMVFDTQSSQIVGNNVYDLKSQPKAGTSTKFDTYTAQYVGNGSTVQ